MTPEVSAVDGSPMATPAPGLIVSLHGPAVTIEDMIEAGRATKQLLKAVAREMGASNIDWQVTSIAFRCDGCGLLRPDRPMPDEGWTHADGDDFCPSCTSRELPR